LNPLRITQLRVEGFRNLTGIRLAPDPRANLFVGANGQGKTSLLEAIDYVATLRSFRGANRAQLVGHEAMRAEAMLRVEGHAALHEFRVSFDRKGREILLDGKRPERAVSYYGGASCVVFHPQDLDLIRGAPELRRRLLDRILVRVVDGYGEALRSYARALKARNAVLREKNPDLRALIAYDPVLARLGSAIVRARQDLTRDLLPAARQAVAEVALTEEEIALAYRTRAPGDAADYVRALREAQPLDLSRRATTMGPHADDVAILWGRRQARAVTSQGQTRALALALRLAELHVLQARSGRLPWLLLDDVSSELDRERTERLFALVAELGAQVWVTTTDPAVATLLPHARVLEVRAGRIVQDGDQSLG
jgi:DNA replication and repair protein RecF